MRRCVKTIKQWSWSHGIAHSHVLRVRNKFFNPLLNESDKTYVHDPDNIIEVRGVNNFKMFAGVSNLSQIDISLFSFISAPLAAECL